jgi:dihydroorotase-like cyclic amidohydrolase
MLRTVLYGGLDMRTALHDQLLDAMAKHPADYAPWGAVERWADADKHYPDCSVGCKYFSALEGKLGYDWGVCTNKKSHRFGLLTFEHQAGVDCFEKA